MEGLLGCLPNRCALWCWHISYIAGRSNQTSRRKEIRSETMITIVISCVTEKGAAPPPVKVWKVIENCLKTAGFTYNEKRSVWVGEDDAKRPNYNAIVLALENM